MLVDSEQVAKAYGTVLQDWRTRFPHATQRIPKGDPFLLLDHDAFNFLSTGTDDISDDRKVDDNIVIEEEAEEDTIHTSDDFDPYIMLSGDESDIFSSGDDTYVFPSVDNDNDSGNVS